MKTRTEMPRSSRQKCRWSITSAIVSLSVVLSVAVAAQNQLYVYPLKKQSSEQQDRDRYECHRWAVQQTGFDPSKAYPSNPNSLDPQPYRPSQPHILKGAGRGAALGAAGRRYVDSAGKMKDANRLLSSRPMLLRPLRHNIRTIPGQWLHVLKDADIASNRGWVASMRGDSVSVRRAVP